ncbi:MAG: hypothetical protein K0B08_01145 [Bacteroidales bacterium]|nr:hypothetical protein [Bacteroidales bacterium]
MKQPLQEGLKTYIPPESLPLVMNWVKGFPLLLRITRGRTTKLGDYRPPVKDPFHRISVNHDLNPYEFLLTLTHEIAHMLVWDQYGRQRKPHGKAWQYHYGTLLNELTGMNIFPDDLKPLVRLHMQQPKANSKSNAHLVRGLDAYNSSQKGIFLEDLPDNAVFHLPDGRKFVKQQKLRTWYRCQNLHNKKIYRISPVTRVVPAGG